MAYWVAFTDGTDAIFEYCPTRDEEYGCWDNGGVMIPLGKGTFKKLTGRDLSLYEAVMI